MALTPLPLGNLPTDDAADIASRRILLSTGVRFESAGDWLTASLLRTRPVASTFLDIQPPISTSLTGTFLRPRARGLAGAFDT